MEIINKVDDVKIHSGSFIQYSWTAYIIKHYVSDTRSFVSCTIITLSTNQDWLIDAGCELRNNCMIRWYWSGDWKWTPNRIQLVALVHVHGSIHDLMCSASLIFCFLQLCPWSMTSALSQLCVVVFICAAISLVLLFIFTALWHSFILTYRVLPVSPMYMLPQLQLTLYTPLLFSSFEGLVLDFG